MPYKTRPVYLKLHQFNFPLNAILSILHRISGVTLIIFLLLGLIILNVWILLPEYFASISNFWQQWLGKVILWLGFNALSFHWLAGLRHLLIENNVWNMQKNIHHSTLSGKFLLFVYLLFLIVISLTLVL